jgi:hypothetical protein
MQGIQIYNTTTATTNNAVGIWFPTGPHQAGIASFRADAEGGWDTTLAFYTHGAATSQLNDCFERVRITGEGNLLVGGTTNLASGKLVVGNNTTNTPLVVRGAGGVDGAFVNCFLSYPYNTTEVNAIQSSISSSGTASGWRFQASVGGGSATTYKTLDSLRDLTVFYTQNTERARINSSGNFGVANTGPEYLVDVGSNSGGAFLRAQGAYLSRKYTFGENLSASRVMRLTISLNGLQFTNIFMDASAHYYNNGGLWQAQRYAFQVMAEGGTLRHNIRMPNYEYGGATAGVFTVGNPPSWTYVSGTTYYFDFTAVAGYVSYIAISAEGPGIVDLTLTVIS